jgi:hypothetical protein
MRLFCACHWAAFADLSTIDHGSITGTGHIRMMDSKSKPLITREEFVSLLVIGNPSAITDLPSVIPAQHRARLIALGVNCGPIRQATDDNPRQVADSGGI